MQLPILAILGLASAVFADGVDITDVDDGATLYTGPIGFPPGIAAPPPALFPHHGPPKGAKKPVPVWHPPHHGVVIDECDDDGNDKWHWAGPHKGGKPHGPPHKWTTSTITATKTKTVIDCEDDVDDCPDHPKTKYTTTTVEVTTTVCPVPVTDAPNPAPEPSQEASDDSPAPPATDAAPPAAEATPDAPAPTPPTEVVEPPAADASSEPEAPVEAGAAKAAVGVLAGVAAFVALF